MIDYNIIRERLSKARSAIVDKTDVFVPILDSYTRIRVLEALNDAALLIDRCEKSDKPASTEASPKAKESHDDTKVAAELLKFKVERLILRPGDLVVLTSPNDLSMEAVKALRETFVSACTVPGVNTIVLTEGVEIGSVVRSAERRTDPMVRIPALMDLFNRFLRLQIVSAAFENGRIVLKSMIRHPDDAQVHNVLNAINNTFPNVSLRVEWGGYSVTVLEAECVPHCNYVCARGMDKYSSKRALLCAACKDRWF